MRIVNCFFILYLYFSCVTVPKETPLLSEELGVQIHELELTHLILVRAFFEKEREQIRRFVDEEWMPLFAENFFNEPGIDQVWQQLVDRGNKEDRLQFIIRTAPEIHRQTNKKYLELTLPLNQLESELTQALQVKYANAKHINQTLTAYLYSAAKVDENRQRYLDRLGITEDRTSTIINEAERVTSELLRGAETLEQLEEQLRLYKEKLAEILSKL